MPIIKANDYIEEYRARALSSDINEITGRTGRRDLTDFVTSNIVAKLDISPAATLVDIGCGDGSVLKKASLESKTGIFIGIVATNEERKRVQGHLQSSRIEVKVGLADATGLPDGFADKIVCNGVFLYVPDVDGAIREIARISKKGARVFIGEIPKINELIGKTYGDSITKWLYFVLQNQGIKAFALHLRRVVKALFSTEPFIISPKKAFYRKPEEFKFMFEQHGFRLIEWFPHLEISPTGVVYESPTRIDYLFGRCK